MTAAAYPLGLIDDAPDVRGSHTLMEIMGGVRRLAAYPPTADNSHLIAGEPIADQGQTGSCVRHALARAIQVHARAEFDPAFALPSARLITYETMTLLGSAWSFDGTTIGACIEAVQGAGVTPEANCQWNPDWDGDPKRIYLDQLTDALDHRDLRAHRVLSSGDMRMDELCAAIAAGKGVILGMDVDATLYQYHGGIWSMTGERLGGHAMAAVGYDDYGNVLLVNSWGPDFGLGGYLWVARDYIADAGRTRSVWVIDTAPRMD